MKRFLAVGDIHYPYHKKGSIKAVLHFAKHWKPDILLFMGDILDMHPISRHDLEAGKMRNLESKRLLRDYKGAFLDVIKPFVEAAPDAERIWVDGNHEGWAARLVERIPGLDGLIDPFHALGLGRWFRYYPQGSIVELGKLAFVHGDGMIRGGTRCAEKAVHRYGSSIRIWHFHTYQAFCRETLKTLAFQSGIAVPCLCALTPHYQRTHINTWVNGFLYGVVGNDSFFDKVVVMWKDKFYAEGRLWGPRGGVSVYGRKRKHGRR